MSRFDNEDPNPIGWPERAYWQALADAEVRPDEVWDLIWGPDTDHSQEVKDGSPMAPERLDGAMPVPPWGRRDRGWTGLLRRVYAEIGEVPEQDEYKIETERFRTGPAGEQERTLSLNYTTEADQEFIDYLEDETEYGLEPLSDDYEGYLDKVKEEAGLTRGEAEAARWILAGNRVLGIDYLERMSEALGVTHLAAKMAWHKARKKLLDHWGNEPEPVFRKPVVRHQVEGAGVHPLTPSRPRREWRM